MHVILLLGRESKQLAKRGDGGENLRQDETASQKLVNVRTAGGLRVREPLLVKEKERKRGLARPRLAPLPRCRDMVHPYTQ
jgi:hypothetical protein